MEETKPKNISSDNRYNLVSSSLNEQNLNKNELKLPLMNQSNPYSKNKKQSKKKKKDLPN